MDDSAPSQIKVIVPLGQPPAPSTGTGTGTTKSRSRSVFLAGTTSKSDWRKTLADAVASRLPSPPPSSSPSSPSTPVTDLFFFNPFRPDWDSTWREDVSDSRFRAQVEWELDMQDRADVVVVYFEPGTEAHVSLLELGLCARSGRAVVACPEGYKKRGNVQAVCSRFGIPLLDGFDALCEELVRRLGSEDSKES